LLIALLAMSPSPIDLREQRERRLRHKLHRELGPDVLEPLFDPSVVEILLNADGEIWVERLGEGVARTGSRMSQPQAENLLGTIAALADTEINETRPILEVELPFDGSRFQGVVPPVSGGPVFAIRKRALRIHTLDDYVTQGIMSPEQREVLREALRSRQNILICGGTGSGKTTLANALLKEAVDLAGPAERFVILEDTVELQCAAVNRVQLRTTDRVDLTRLVRATMRLRPDRIIVGEVRGREALALLKAWNTGHPGGVTTVHANGARAALSRIDQLVQEAGVPSQRRLIAETIDLIVSIARTSGGWRVEEILRIAGYDSEHGFWLDEVELHQQQGGEHDVGAVANSTSS
jgi:type IV secretion system protein VirB11